MEEKKAQKRANKRTLQARSYIKFHGRNTKINKPDKEKGGERPTSKGGDGNLSLRGEEEKGKRGM
jgi:hypothetical protein